MVEEVEDHIETEAVDMEEKGMINLIFNVMNAIDMTIIPVSAGQRIIINLQKKSNSSKKMEWTILY